MRQVDRILGDPDLAAELTRRMPELRREHLPRAIIVPPGETTEEGRDFTDRAAPPPPALPLTKAAEQPQDVLAVAADVVGIEAIIRRFGRPSLPVRNDSFEVPASDTWKGRLYPTQSRLERAIRSVGRLEVPAIGIPHVGTAWMVAPDVAVTNRHVALTFAQQSGAASFTFRTTPIGQRFAAKLDFREEAAQTTPFEVEVADILYIAEATPRAPDIAFLRVRSLDGRPLPPPLPLYEAAITPGQVVAAIGYPAEDPRNPYLDQARIFGGVFNVKRIAPGEVIGVHEPNVFSHDCTTLGGSSGSLIVDVSSGEALGLHYAGLYLEANYALSADGIRASLQRSKKKVKLPRHAPEAPPREGLERAVEPSELAHRTGYDAAFLGTGTARVKMPRLTAGLASEALVTEAGNQNPGRFELRYHHFSVVMHAARRMAIYAAVNIDGSQTDRRKRTGDPWAKDPRISAESQIGNELYIANDLDRGHLVRRLDPTWGRAAAAAELDTYFYTNCAPQHASYNQTLWRSLEDYLLDHADTLDFRASVFTGPIFGSADPVYRGVPLPTSFWKVAVMKRAHDGKLSASGYMVSQSDLLTGLEFVYGQYKTYQVPLARIESLTGLTFGSLRRADPLGQIEALAAVELRGPEDLAI